MRHVTEVIRLEGGNEYREGEFASDDERLQKDGRPQQQRGLNVHS